MTTNYIYSMKRFLGVRLAIFSPIPIILGIVGGIDVFLFGMGFYALITIPFISVSLLIRKSYNKKKCDECGDSGIHKVQYVGGTNGYMCEEHKWKE